MSLALAIRVLAWIAGAWLSGLFIGAQWQLEVGVGLAGLSWLGALVLIVHGRELRARLWVLPLSFLAFAGGLGVAPPSSPPCSVRGYASLTAKVSSVRYGIGEARVRLKAIDGRMSQSQERIPDGVEVSLKLATDRAPPEGAIIALDATLYPRVVLRNPSPHPRLGWPRARGCWGRWDPRGRLETRPATPLRERIHALRARVRRHMDETLPQEVAGVARALVLGDGGALDYKQRQTIAAVGLAHLFAVSGLHIALVSGTMVRTLEWLLRGWTIRMDARRIAAALGIPLTLLHAVFAGGSPSAWRAAITAAFTWSLVVVARRPSASAVTAAAALVLSAPNPATALRPAFLLSIVATSAILSAPRVSGSQPWKRLRASAIISARTLVATTPMVWWWFGGVPIIGWLTNILVLPFGAWVVIPLAHLHAVTADLPSIGDHIGAALTASVHLLLSLSDAFEPLAITRRLPPLSVTQGLTVLACCVLFLAARAWPLRFAALLTAAVLWWSAEHALIRREQPRGLLRMTFVDVGQGDAILIDFPDGQMALVDTGQGGRHPAARELAALLHARRRERIDLLVITHGHPDHFGALPQLLDEVEVGELWVNGQLLSEEQDGTMERLLSSARARGTKVRFPSEICSASPERGGARLEVLWPCPRYDPALDLNDNSITLRVEHGERSFLLTGDLEAEAEQLLLRSGRIQRADVLKVPHHGSRTSTTPSFVDAVHPSLAVISSGAHNPYGHPSPLVVERLRASGAEILRTDVHGGLVVSTDGTRLHATTWRGDAQSFFDGP